MASVNPKMVGATPVFQPASEWRYTFEELNKANLTGQVALVTGANSGIGYTASLALARLGASVTLACRNETKCEEAADQIRSDRAVMGEVTTMVVDISSLKSVKAFAERYIGAHESLDMLFLNAGIGVSGINDDGTFSLSEDGVELIFATNVLRHYLLYRLVEPALKRSALARVVLTSSAASFRPYDYDGNKVATNLKALNGPHATPHSALNVYGSSKLAQILLAKEMTRRLGPDSNIFANAFHPGVVNTPIFDKAPFFLHFPAPVMYLFNRLREKAFWNATEGSLTMLYLGVATDQLVSKNIRGKFFHPQAHENVNPFSLDEELARNLWGFCDSLVKDYI